jgi:hypothetical protein
MKHHRFRADPMTSRLQQMTTILGMIDDLNRTGRLLDFDIERCPDRSTQASLTKRRAKLQETIGTLEARLTLLCGTMKTRWREPAGLVISARQPAARAQLEGSRGIG